VAGLRSRFDLSLFQRLKAVFADFGFLAGGPEVTYPRPTNHPRTFATVGRSKWPTPERTITIHDSRSEEKIMM
jgi:hypothetical protein